MGRIQESLALAGVLVAAGGALAEAPQAEAQSVADHNTTALAHVASAGIEAVAGNDIVCGGVPSKKVLIEYTEGKVDPCGHKDIKEIWASFGITTKVAETMRFSNNVAASAGYLSQGREHSPQPQEDVLDTLGDGISYFKRPLSAWGQGIAYPGWITPNGQKAVLMNCGNGEEIVEITPVHKKTKTEEVEVQKIAEDATGKQLPAVPTNTFRFEVTDSTKGMKPKTVMYNGTPQDLGKFPVGSHGTVTELTPNSNEQWVLVSPKTPTQHFTVGNKVVKVVFKDREVAPAPAPAPAAPIICSNVNSPSAGGNCNTTTPLPTPPNTPPAVVPPTITFEAAPPAQEQYTDGYTYQDNADITYPAGDQVLVTFGTTNANEGSASSAFQPDATASPQKWSTDVSMASGDYIDPNFGVIGTITDETTGLSATVTDVMGTQAMPSLGN